MLGTMLFEVSFMRKNVLHVNVQNNSMTHHEKCNSLSMKFGSMPIKSDLSNLVKVKEEMNESFNKVKTK